MELLKKKIVSNFDANTNNCFTTLREKKKPSV